MTFFSELVASHLDSFGYITYVFKNLEEDVAAISRYVMCIRYPNWNHKQINIGEKGYLEFEEIRAGIDSWFNGNTMIPYKYSAIQFIRFISKQDNPHEYIM